MQSKNISSKMLKYKSKSKNTKKSFIFVNKLGGAARGTGKTVKLAPSSSQSLRSELVSLVSANRGASRSNATRSNVTRSNGLSSASRRAAMESSSSKTRRKQRREENAAENAWNLKFKNNNNVGNIVDVDYSVKLYHQLHDNKGLRTQFKSFMEELPIIFRAIYVIDNENGVYVNFGERSTLSIHNGNYDTTGKSRAAIHRAELSGNMHVHFKAYDAEPEKYVRISISSNGKQIGFHSINVLVEQEIRFVKKIIKLIKKFIKLHPWS
jgi:hypothetical protein